MSGIDLTTEHVSLRDRWLAPKPLVLCDGTPCLTTETHALLRSRLRAVVLLLVLAFGIFLVRGLLLPDPDPVSTTLHGIVLAVFAGCLLMLRSRRELSHGQLRAIELTIFGLAVCFVATTQYRLVLRREQQDNPVMAVAAIKSSAFYSFSLMAIYGIFIPNTWRRAALVVLPMALTTPFVMQMLRLRHPELHATAERMASFEQISDNLLMLLLGATTSVFGTHIINKLRTEAFEARQLGQYVIGERIGSGGMGEVFKAEHQLLKRPCAIKLIRPDNAADPRALARFEREVRTTATLSHWNTVEIYDYGRTDDGTFYYVMEFLPGMSFADLVERYGPLPPERVIHLLRQACNALAEAHARGLIHRDIKPANLFAADRGGLHDVTKLLDFGLVKPTADRPSIEVSNESTITGSPLYISPEQVTGNHRADRRSDLYALGAVAYFLLTGRAPFSGSNAIGIMIAHARDPVAPPSSHRDGIPDDLERVVLRCLAKNPDDRFQSAQVERALAACRAADRWTRERCDAWWRQVESAPTTAPETTAEVTPDSGSASATALDPNVTVDLSA